MDKISYIAISDAGLINSSSDPIHVFGFTADGADASLINFRDGTITGDIVISQTVVGDNRMYPLGVGVIFPNGCYYEDPDAAGADIVIYYTKVSL